MKLGTEKLMFRGNIVTHEVKPSYDCCCPKTFGTFDIFLFFLALPGDESLSNSVNTEGIRNTGNKKGRMEIVTEGM